LDLRDGSPARCIAEAIVDGVIEDGWRRRSRRPFGSALTGSHGLLRTEGIERSSRQASAAAALSPVRVKKFRDRLPEPRDPSDATVFPDEGAAQLVAHSRARVRALAQPR